MLKPVEQMLVKEMHFCTDNYVNTVNEFLNQMLLNRKVNLKC